MEAELNTQIIVGTKTEDEKKPITIEAPLFILFAEYFGYVSIFNKVAEDWCDGKVPETHIQKVIILEAKCILRQMKKDFNMDDVRELYEDYYPLILEEYDNKLNKLLTVVDDI
jgi:hypothetical protein